MVEPNANDSAAALRLFGKEQVAELVILEELVGDRRDASPTVSLGPNLSQRRVAIPHNGGQPGPQFHSFEVRDVLLEMLVHLLLVLLESREFREVVLRYDTA